MRTHRYYVYILTNRSNNVLYTGVTNDLERRCMEHKSGHICGFTKRYNINKLVYFEEYGYIDAAIAREKQIKGLMRIKKIYLIQSFNSGWEDLCPDGKVSLPLKKTVKYHDGTEH